MPLTASQLVLRSKQLEMEAVGRMGARVELASLIGQTIHALQRERGASSLFLSSGCQRLCEERLAAMRDAVRLEAQLGESIAHQAEPESQCNASMVSLMAWVQLDLATLPALRQRIGEGTATAHEVVAAFSRLIAALLELIFHLADVAIYPGIARPLVAFVYLVQGKEAAGQERAVGAQAFASGKSTEALQQRIHHLIDAQQNSFQMLERFADPALLPAWRQWQGSTTVATLEQLRRTLLTTPAEGALDTETSETWYQVCSARIADMWAFEKQLVQGLRKACDEQVRKCQADLNDAAGLLRQLLDNPPPHTHAVERFFDADAPLGAAPTLRGMPQASDGSDATAHRLRRGIAGRPATATGGPSGPDGSRTRCGTARSGRTQDHRTRQARVDGTHGYHRGGRVPHVAEGVHGQQSPPSRHRRGHALAIGPAAAAARLSHIGPLDPHRFARAAANLHQTRAHRAPAAP